MAQKLSVLIAVKNHRQYIEACIESVRELADEIVIADSGATDDTLELAVAACEGHCMHKIIARDYITATSFKNWAIPQATHAWVLILDVDERLTDRLADEIRSTLDHDPTHEGYRILRRNYFIGRRVQFGGWNNDRILRLIRRDLFQYPNPDSEHQDFVTEGHSIGRLKYPMDHFTRASYDEHLTKCNRYTAIQAQRWYRQGRRASFLQLAFRPPFRFFRSYVLYGGFLDGFAGLQLAYLAAHYTFMKQARLWELYQADPPVENDSHADHGPSVPRPSNGRRRSNLTHA